MERNSMKNYKRLPTAIFMIFIQITTATPLFVYFINVSGIYISWCEMTYSIYKSYKGLRVKHLILWRVESAI